MTPIIIADARPSGWVLTDTGLLGFHAIRTDGETPLPVFDLRKHPARSGVDRFEHRLSSNSEG